MASDKNFTCDDCGEPCGFLRTLYIGVQSLDLCPDCYEEWKEDADAF